MKNMFLKSALMLTLLTGLIACSDNFENETNPEDIGTMIDCSGCHETSQRNLPYYNYRTNETPISVDQGTEPEFVLAADSPLSTFSVDVDTGAYTIARQSVKNNSMPSKGNVRTEEFLNYFKYEVPSLDKFTDPIYTDIEFGPSSWSENQLVKFVV